MPDKERLTQLAAGLSIPTTQHHIFLCAEQTKPKCCSLEAGVESWDYLKRRLAELGLLDRIYRTKANCLRICEAGPIAVVYPEGAWYHACVLFFFNGTAPAEIYPLSLHDALPI